MSHTTSGGRRLTHAALAARKFGLEAERSVSRKELASAARDAEKALGLRPAARLVLHEIVGVWGEQDIGGQLLVWPSNEYLVERTGLSERSVRYAIASLVDMQLLRPKDSANGKRFAIRNGVGEVLDAYGFDLTPLYARRDEFQTVLLELKRQKDIVRRQFDQITICRRAVESALLELGEAPALEKDLAQLLTVTPRRAPSVVSVEGLLDQWKELRKRAEEAFYESGCAGNSSRHIETNNGAPREPCNKAAFRDGERATSVEPISIIDLVQACPVLSDYDGALRSDLDVISAGQYLRPSIGAHESAWREAAEVIGPFNAAMAVILVLQLHDDDVASGENRIKNPGGYFRALVRMIAEGRYSLTAEIMRMRKRRRS